VPLRDVVAMQCRQPNLEGTGEIKLRRLVKEALRMRPSRIIVGEVRQEESLDLLLALTSGMREKDGSHCRPDPRRLAAV
jgi:pilus assembly protein CpaF